MSTVALLRHCTCRLHIDATCTFVVCVCVGVHELMVCEAKWHFMLEAALIGGVTLLMGSCIDRIGYGRYSSSFVSCRFRLLHAELSGSTH